MYEINFGKVYRERNSAESIARAPAALGLWNLENVSTSTYLFNGDPVYVPIPFSGVPI